MQTRATSRRRFLRGLTAASVGVAGWQALERPGAGLARVQRAAAPTADEALQMLMDGNARYVSSNTRGPNRGLDRRAEVTRGQAPFATILSCADSRVPPELVFDAGLGDLFVLRVAGNVLNDELLGSVEYGAEHLHAPLIMVLGHERCGAVDATVEALTRGAQFVGHIPSLARAIAPAVERVRGQAGDLLENAIRANVALVVEQLAGSHPVVAEMVDHGAVKVVGAYYSLQTGQVTITAQPN